MKHAIIFDLDGTLIDSQPLQFKAYKQALSEINLPLTWDDWVTHWVHQSISAYDWKSINNLDFDVEAVRTRKRELYEALIRSELTAKPGALPLLAELKSHNTPLAIASSSRIESIELIVETLFPHTFDLLQSDTELAHHKPHPEIFLLTMERMGVPPQNTIIVEDSISGYQAALASGASCVICPDTTVSPKHDFAEAHLRIQSLEELSHHTLMEL